MSETPDISTITVPDTIPTTTVFETASSQMEVFGTPAEIVTQYTALGWIAEEETELAITMTHPLIRGTVRYIRKFPQA